MTIQDIAATSLANSRRWFPHVPTLLDEPRARLLHCTLGVCGEIGEVWEAHEIGGFENEQTFEELTDVLIYLVIIAELTETVLDEDEETYDGLPSAKLIDLTVRIGRLANEIKKINRAGWAPSEYELRISEVQYFVRESVALCLGIFRDHGVEWPQRWHEKTITNDARWGAIATVKYGTEVVGDGETRS